MLSTENTINTHTMYMYIPYQQKTTIGTIISRNINQWMYLKVSNNKHYPFPNKTTMKSIQPTSHPRKECLPLIKLTHN